MAMTSLPVWTIPGKPEGAKQERRNQDLRSRVVGFLNEVRRAEEYAQRARVAGWPRADVEANMRGAHDRMMAAAAAVAKDLGRDTSGRPGRTLARPRPARVDTNPFRLEA